VLTPTLSDQLPLRVYLCVLCILTVCEDKTNEHVLRLREDCRKKTNESVLSLQGTVTDSSSDSASHTQ